MQDSDRLHSLYLLNTELSSKTERKGRVGGRRQRSMVGVLYRLYTAVGPEVCFTARMSQCARVAAVETGPELKAKANEITTA